jgi:hypothetical protein
MHTLPRTDKARAVQLINAICPLLTVIEAQRSGLAELETRLHQSPTTFDSYEAWEKENALLKQTAQEMQTLYAELADTQRQLAQLYCDLRTVFPTYIWILIGTGSAGAIDGVYYRLTHHGHISELEWRSLDDHLAILALASPDGYPPDES